MAVIAKCFIKTSKKVYSPNDVINGLPDKEEQRLVNLGAADYVVSEVVVDVTFDGAVVEALDTMSKKELVRYGAIMGIKLSDRDNKNKLIDALKDEDLILDELTDEALAVLAKYDGIDVNLPREELIAALSAGE